MFGFDEEEAEELGSAGRFEKRIDKFEEKGKWFPRLQHYFWWVIHNAVSHPLLIIPIPMFFAFHDWTSRKINAE